MDIKWLILYFFLGGTIVPLVTYFGGQGKGLLAAFVAFFPSITVLSMFTIYFTGGLNATTSYFRNMLLVLPAWLLYVIPVMLLLPRLGPIPSVLIGISAYLGAAFLTIRLAG